MRTIKKTLTVVLACIMCVCMTVGCSKPIYTPTFTWLHKAYGDYFPIGAAVMPYSLTKYEDILPHFNSITAENSMKWRVTEPNEGEYAYADGDALVAWAKEHNTAVRGHCLLWYKSLPKWVRQKAVDKESALDLIKKHVRDIVTHYGDSIYAWDVVNEALKSTVTVGDIMSGEIYRTGNITDPGSVDWYELTGVEFITTAFGEAAKVRDELGLDFDLYYNDYSLNDPKKREACVMLVNMLRAADIPIDGIGMQAHYRLPSFTKNKQSFLNEFEQSIRTFTELGLDVQITELDICIYASSGDPQVFDGLPYSQECAQAEMYGELFKICRKYAKPFKKGAGKVTGITTWGVADANNAHNSSAHREFPLLFGVDGAPKKAVYSVIDF